MSSPETRRLRLGILLCAVGASCWGISGNIAQYLMASKGLSAEWISLVRMLAGGVLLSLYCLAQEGRRFFALWRNPASIWEALLYGTAGVLLSQYVFVLAIAHANAGTATMLQYTGPIGVLLFVCAREHRRPTGREALAIALAVFGTFLIATHGQLGTLVISAQALGYGLLAALGMMIATLTAAPLVRRHGAFPVTAWVHLIGAVSLLLLGTPLWPAVPWDGAMVLGIVALVLVGTFGAFGLFMQGLGMVGPVRASMVGCMEPVSAAVFSALFLGTVFLLMDLAGFACILATIFLLARA